MLTFRVTTHTQFGHFGAWALLIVLLVCELTQVQYPIRLFQYHINGM